MKVLAQRQSLSGFSRLARLWCLPDWGDGQIVAHALMRAAFTVLTGVSGNKHVDVIGNKTFPIEG